jgi:hypothetical protein
VFPVLASALGSAALTAVLRRAVVKAGKPAQRQPETSMTQTDPTTTGTATEPTSSPSLEQYYFERLANVREHLPNAAKQLKSAGVACVHIQYDGCGDSGQIEGIEYRSEDGKPIDILGKVTITDDELMDLFYDLTQARHPGWENNDGAFGEFEWNLTGDTLTHTHNDRFTDYDTTEHEGL